MYRYIRPGLERRLSYDRQRRRRRANTANTDTLTQSTEMDSYENYFRLEDIKTGLINKNFVKNSELKQSHGMSFCVICQDHVCFDIIRCLKKCGHTFHAKCIDTWFTTSKKCPICNKFYD